MIAYKGINPEGGSIESFNRDDIPEHWEVLETEIENPNVLLAETEIEALRSQTRSEISSLIFEHTQKMLMRNVPIPEEIQSEYDRKRSEYKNQKQAIYEKYGVKINP